jgi:5-methylcytosine-specific restriction endonuclease McrA
MQKLEIKKIKQYGDNMMFMFDCPCCDEPQFTNNPQQCDDCEESYENHVIDIAKHVFKCEAGTRRKARYKFNKMAEKLIVEQDHKCAYCFIPFGNKYHVEHIIPLACGGTNNESNICLACPECNMLASDFYFTDFYAKQRFILESKRKRNKRTKFHADHS